MKKVDKSKLDNYLKLYKKAQEDRKEAREELIKIKEEIDGLKTQKQTLIDEIESSNTELYNIDQSVAGKQTLIDEVESLKGEKLELETVIEENKSVSQGIINEIERLDTRKKEVDELVKQLNDEYGLYSKDLKNIVKRLTTQSRNYLGAIGISFCIALSFIGLLLCFFFTNHNPVSKSIIEMLGASVNFKFYSLLIIRFSFVGACFILIYIFMNLTKSFVAQYIRTQEKLSSINILDFLVQRLESENVELQDDVAKKEYLSKLTKDKVELMSQHIPDLMESHSTKFDKNNDSKNLMKLIKEIMSLRNE